VLSEQEIVLSQNGMARKSNLRDIDGR